MSNSAKPAAQPVIIVFGVSAIGKPRAGTFKDTDISAARKAATKLGLTVIEITDPIGRALAAKISMGRIGASADGIVPFVSKDIYEQIKALGSPQQKNGKGEVTATTVASPAVKFRLPENWDDIRVGDRVLAQDADPADGWLHARVTEAHGDLLKLSWPRGGLFQKHRAMLGLMCPDEIKEPVKPDPKQAAAKPVVYPAHWSVIGVRPDRPR